MELIIHHLVDLIIDLLWEIIISYVAYAVAIIDVALQHHE